MNVQEPNMPYQIGLAKIDITPPIGIYLAGYANRLEPSEGVYLPLTATAIAICDGQESALIIGAEILGFYEHTDRVRKAIGEKTGLLPHQILLFGSHTHCGPVLRDVDRERQGALDENYIDTLVAKIADCAQQAWNNREPSLLKFGTGTCNFASNRRMPDENGAMQMRPNPISVEYALRLKRELTPTFSHALIAAYANRIIGYVPVQRQIPEGGYEIWTNQYTLKRTGPFVAETEDHICQTVHAQLNCS
jgi:hypothetical protein